MQPLDVAFMRPFETYYTQEIETWLRNHPGRVVTHYQIAGLMGKAYLRTASAETAVSSFRKTGICPMNRHVFREHDLIIQETDITILGGESSTSHSNADRCTQSPSTVVHPSHISPLLTLPIIPQTISRNSRHGTPLHMSGSPYRSKLKESKSNPTTMKSAKEEGIKQ
jgi:hypothetical protein